MAFNIQDFNNVSSGAAEGLKVWSYTNLNDSLATMTASGYFNDAKFRIGSGDIIFVLGSNGSDILKVTSANGATATTVVYVPSSGGAPNDATFIVQVANADLPNEQALGSLATGIVKNTTATGVLSIATSNVDYQAADAGLISIAGLTTAANKMIYTTASDVYAVTDLTAAGIALLDDASASAQLTTLGAQAALSGATLTAATVATDDKVLIQDTDAADALKTVTVQSILDLAGGGGGMTWTAIGGTSQTAAVNNGYISDDAGQTTITLPAVCAVGDIVSVQGLGAAGWILDAPAGDVINIGQSPTSAGGTVTSAGNYDSISVICVVANSSWAMLSCVTAGFTIA